MLKEICFFGLSLCAVGSFAKAPNSLCVPGSDGTEFPSGSGTKADPYLICNIYQQDRLGLEDALLNKYFILGVDIHYNDYPYHFFKIIGTPNRPFKGGYNGDGYELTSIILPRDREEYIAPFGYVEGGTIENLSTEVSVPDGNKHVAGLVAFGITTSLNNVHTQANLYAGEFSGGLVGELVDSDVSKCSSEGALRQISGTSASGGIVGYSMNVDMDACKSTMALYPAHQDAVDIKMIGGVIGHANHSRMQNVYSQSFFGYDRATQLKLSETGGLVGLLENSSIKFGYFAGKMQFQIDDIHHCSM
jgi:hypothetical protein